MQWTKERIIPVCIILVAWYLIANHKDNRKDNTSPNIGFKYFTCNPRKGYWTKYETSFTKPYSKSSESYLVTEVNKIDNSITYTVHPGFYVGAGGQDELYKLDEKGEYCNSIEDLTIKYPAVLGQKWNSKSEYKDVGRYIKINYEIINDSCMVKTPAGIFFECLEMKSTNYTKDTKGYWKGNSFTINSRQWFAPNVGLIKWVRDSDLDGSRHTTELVEYGYD